MNQTIPKEIKEVIDKVRQGIEDYQQSGFIDYDLQVDDDGYLKDEDWLYIVVKPMNLKKRIHASDYAQVLGEIEAKLKARGIEKILLVPGSPD